MEELHNAGVRHSFKTLLPEIGVGEQARHVHQRQAVFDQHDQSRGHHVGEVRRFLQALRPGPPEGFQHCGGDVVWVFCLGCQDVERDDLVRAGRVDVDQPLADVGAGKDIAGDEQPKQVIRQEGVGIDQAATTASGDILI